jgi:ABC-type methionine transport system ATPase subunit
LTTHIFSSNFHTICKSQEKFMATKWVKLIFPRDLIKEPVIFTMAKQFDVMPNIRKARVTESMGEMVVELEGAEKKIDEGIAHLRERGVTVEAIDGP